MIAPAEGRDIIIGESSIRVADIRCRKELFDDTIHRPEIPSRKRSDDRSRVRSEDNHKQRESDKITNLGYRRPGELPIYHKVLLQRVTIYLIIRAIGALLTFDITSRESFDAIHGFVEETTTSASKNLVIILIGNKSDLASERQVSKEEAETYAKRLGLIYIEVSAKTGHNVNIAFDMVAEKVLEKIDRKEIIPEDEV